MNILIIEPFASGHHGEYLRWIVSAILPRGHHVQLATFNESLNHPAVQATLATNKQAISLITECSQAFGTQNGNVVRMTYSMIRFRGIFRGFYKRAIRKCSVDFVLLPYLDYCTYSIALLGSPFGKTPWAGIIMRPAFHYSPMRIKAPITPIDSYKEKLFYRLLRNPHLRMLFTIDKSLHEYATSGARGDGSRLVYLPDPTGIRRSLSREHAKYVLGIPAHATGLLVYGALTLRKGIEILLRATEEKDFPSEVHILLAGRQEEAVEAVLRSPTASRLRQNGRLHEINRYLDKGEEATVFSAADAVWLGYLGHYQMSGVLAQAAAMGLPVIACEEGLIGWLTIRYRSGIVVQTSSTGEVARAVRELCRDPERAKQYGENGRMAYASHTIDHVVDILLKAIEAK